MRYFGNLLLKIAVGHVFDFSLHQVDEFVFFFEGFAFEDAVLVLQQFDFVAQGADLCCGLTQGLRFVVELF
jgi:hypothetical protein